MVKKFFCCVALTLLFAAYSAAENPQIQRDRERGIVFSEKGRILVKFPNTLPDREYRVPHGVVIIAERAFYQCSKLENVIFPSTLRAVRRYAFAHCSNLETLHFPHNMRHIAFGAFFKCDKLRVVRIYAGAYINKNAFPGKCRIARYR